MPGKRKVKEKEPPLKTRSGFEHKIAQSLAKAGVDFKYEKSRIKYTVPAANRHYIPDFELPNGIIIEAKGKFDKLARQKMALVIEQNPDKDIRILFMRNNKINKSAKMRYGDWCDRRGIKWAVSEDGQVPEEWLNE